MLLTAELSLQPSDSISVESGAGCDLLGVVLHSQGLRTFHGSENHLVFFSTCIRKDTRMNDPQMHSEGSFKATLTGWDGTTTWVCMVLVHLSLSFLNESVCGHLQESALSCTQVPNAYQSPQVPLCPSPSPRSQTAGTGPMQPDTEGLDTDMASDRLLSVYFSFI